MKRILHISKYYYPFSGGTEQIARDCVCALKDEFIQKVIAFNEEKGKDECIKVDGIDVVKCKCIAKISSQSVSLYLLRDRLLYMFRHSSMY
jgi:N-acetyllactosaminide 3-alpha-galactosyltransferase/rhamnosyl/mannosyltransferase